MMLPVRGCDFQSFVLIGRHGEFSTTPVEEPDCESALMISHRKEMQE